MLKFLNRDPEENEREFNISVLSTQGGAQLEFDMIENGKKKVETLFMTPMDAAFFVNQVESSRYVACEGVGHTSEGDVLRVYVTTVHSGKWHFVGHPGVCSICVGGIVAAVPAFVIEAIALSLKQMMTSLMYPTTGEMEEEFG